jgi:hypothetical protein
MRTFILKPKLPVAVYYTGKHVSCVFEDLWKMKAPNTNDLCGVNRDVIEQSLNVDPAIMPRKQKLQKMSDDKAEGARNEVKRLLSVGVIREVTYPGWLANTVMVKKANGKCRICIDFTDLNKAYLNDEFPLPRIDSLVDAAATSKLMSLLDCYSGYHQI